MKRINLILLALFVSVSIISCEETPEGIQSALFDETGIVSPELQLTFSFRNDVNNVLDITKARNGVANWGERLYFDTTIRNTLEDDVSDVNLIITGADNTLNVVNWNRDVLNFGFINQFSSGVPDTYWCFFCNQSNEEYLGRTWIETSPSGFGTSSNTINIRITFTYQGNFYIQETTHTITIFP